MAWTTLRTVVDGTSAILASDHNDVKGNLDHVADGVSLRLTQQATAPSAPGAGLVAIYAKTDGSVYLKAGASGSETSVGGSGYARAFLLMGG